MFGLVNFFWFCNIFYTVFLFIFLMRT